jgi:hypothetical protein
MAAHPDPTPSRILYIGNSYTSRNQLPRLVADLAAAAAHPRRVEFELIFAGGASLKRHWNAGIAREKLARLSWNYVVLQEQSTLPLKNPARYHENVRLFAPEIARCGARPALYLTWSRQQAPDTQDRITGAVEKIAAEVDALVVPVGPAWGPSWRDVAICCSTPTTAVIRQRSAPTWRRVCSWPVCSAKRRGDFRSPMRCASIEASLRRCTRWHRSMRGRDSI